MSSTINIAFVRQYQDMLLHLAQQEGSKLLGAVRQKPLVGRYAYFDRLGPGVARQKTSRHAQVEYADRVHTRRRVELQDWYDADLIDSEDELRMLIDPKSDYARNMAMALGRKIDDIILTAALGNSVSVDADEAGSNVSLPSTQIVDEDFSSANTNMSIAKLIEAKRLLDKHTGGSSGRRFMAVNASAMAALLNTTQVTSSDYNSVKALVKGEVNSFMGFEFIQVADGLLAGVADGTDTNPIKCVAWEESGIGLALPRSITVSMDRMPQYHNATQVLAQMTLGAVRVEEEKVVQIECVQAA